MARQPYYKILGLDAPPKDRREVKLAYSKQLKLTRPEEDPDGFMRLRNAHDTALEQLKWAVQAEPVVVKDTVTFEDMIDPQIVEEDGESYTTYAMGRTQSLEIPPQFQEREDSPTGYAIGPTPNLDAPVQSRESEPEPERPAIDQQIINILNTPEKRNDRESWNALFRTARQLDIDDYVDFEALLLQRVLGFHGFFDDNNPHFDTPEKMPKHLSVPITASLFKTMNWDQVGKFGYNQTYQINWLERRMGLHAQQPIQTSYGSDYPSSKSGIGRWFWPALGLVFALALILDVLGS